MPPLAPTGDLQQSLEAAPGVPLDDVVEVSNSVAALEHGLARLRSTIPPSAAEGG